jgi:hypothetical protein
MDGTQGVACRRGVLEVVMAETTQVAKPGEVIASGQLHGGLL